MDTYAKVREILERLDAIESEVRALAVENRVLREVARAEPADAPAESAVERVTARDAIEGHDK